MKFKCHGPRAADLSQQQIRLALPDVRIAETKEKREHKNRLLHVTLAPHQGTKLA